MGTCRGHQHQVPLAAIGQQLADVLLDLIRLFGFHVPDFDIPEEDQFSVVGPRTSAKSTFPCGGGSSGSVESTPIATKESNKVRALPWQWTWTVALGSAALMRHRFRRHRGRPIGPTVWGPSWAVTPARSR